MKKIKLTALPCICADVFDGTDIIRPGGEALNFAAHASHFGAIDVTLLGIIGIEVSEEKEILDEEIEKLIEERTQARKSKNFARADEIRDELETEGIRLSRETLTDIIIHSRKIRHKRADFIQTVCISHADKFISEVIGTLKQKYDLSLPVIWIGGGYQFMKNYIKKDVDIFTVEEFDTFANADAYEVLVRANYAKDLKRPA